MHDKPANNRDSYPTANQYHAERGCHQPRDSPARANDKHAVPCHYEDDQSRRLPRNSMPDPHLPDPINSGYSVQLHPQDPALRSGLPDRVLERVSDEDRDCERREVLKRQKRLDLCLVYI